MSLPGSHPLLIFGFGVILGYHIRKYRRELLAASGGSDDQGVTGSGILAAMHSGVQQGAHDARRR